MIKHKFNRVAWWSLTALLAASLAVPAWTQASEMIVGKAIYHDTSAPMSNMALDSTAPTGEKKQIPIMEREEYGRYPDLAEPDGGLQSQISPAIQLSPTPAPILSAPGLSEQDNRDTVGFSVVPPDINGDIGLDGSGNRIFIQYINSVWGVFDATTGALTNGPFAGNSFWAGFGGFCQNNNDGDPVVLYDDGAGRWFFSQFSINQGIQCVAVSTTSNPLGPYHRYAFTVTPRGANDYPKLGVWDDGTTGSAGQSAYTFTMRDFGGDGGSFSVSAGVMERDAMLVGAPAQFVKFINPCTGSNCIEGQLPPHLAGPTPPAGTCPTYWAAVDAAYDDSPFANDGYRNHTLCVDWATLANSTYTEGPLVVAGSNFDRYLGNGFSDCISPVNGGEVLDCLAIFTMYRAQYRWFGAYGSVVLNTTVDAGSDRAGIRWAETRSADGDSGWFLQQDGTYAPADGLERWMGSIAQDQDGNIALGYSAAGSSLFPSVHYTSRMSGDAAGTMPGGEVICHTGTGAQTASSNRWGDYSSMSVDPTDDCTFWYTQEYYETTGSFDFNTRICSFRFAGCGGPPPPCTSDLDCDDSAFCNGAETCNVGTGNCEAGTPTVCDDGVGCTNDSCNETTDSCDSSPDDTLCDDGAFCNSDEICDPELDCQAGIDPCPSGACDEVDDVCLGGCGDGICDSVEDCDSCPADCPSGGEVLPGCGNGVCEPGIGEDCLSCAADCRGKQNGKPANRFCCGDGDGENPISCFASDGTVCNQSGFTCSETLSGGFCCGDTTCDEGGEECSICDIDCSGDPICSGGTCELGQPGDNCTVNGDCCSNKCKGKPGNLTCR